MSLKPYNGYSSEATPSTLKGLFKRSGRYLVRADWTTTAGSPLGDFALSLALAVVLVVLSPFALLVRVVSLFRHERVLPPTVSEPSGVATVATASDPVEEAVSSIGLAASGSWMISFALLLLAYELADVGKSTQLPGWSLVVLWVFGGLAFSALVFTLAVIYLRQGRSNLAKTSRRLIAAAAVLGTVTPILLVMYAHNSL